MATCSSTLDAVRNPSLTQAQLESTLRTNLGFTKFIWLTGAFGGTSDITDMHIDGFMRFAPNRTIVTMSNADLAYWLLPAADIATLYAATDINGVAYNFVRIPLTANNVSTTSGTNLGYKGSYANNVVLVPAYNDPNDAPARALIAPLYPGRTVVGIDVRNLYQNGGMVHCVTQQQPAVPLKLDGSAGAAGSIALTFAGDSGHSYRLQASTTLQTGSWTDIESFTLSGATKNSTIPMSGYDRRFFRVATP